MEDPIKKKKELSSVRAELVLVSDLLVILKFYETA